MLHAAGLALAAAVALVQAPRADAPNLRPGQYEKTTDVSMAGRKMPSRTDTTCIEGKDLKDLAKALATRKNPDECTISDYKATAGAVAYTQECALPGGARTTMTTDVTFTSPESFRALVVMKTSGGTAPMPFLQDTTITVTAKRIGDCKK